MDLSEKLKLCRSSKKLTQLEVSNKLNVSRKTISGWENGHSYPDTDCLVKLSDIYNIPLDDLLRNDKLLGLYNNKETEHLSVNKKVKGTYLLNGFLSILCCIDFFRFAGIHSTLIPACLLVNMFFFSIYFHQWNRFADGKSLIKMFTLFICFLLLNLALNFVDPNFNYYMNHMGSRFMVGFVLGRLILITLISLSWEILLFFKP